MELKIDENMMKEVVHKAIMDQMDAEARSTLISEALKHLLETPKGNSYGYQKSSPLQEAFNRAVEVSAAKIVHEMVANDGKFQRTIREKIADTFLKIDEINFTDHFAQAMASALRKVD